MKVTCVGTGSSGNCFYVESERGAGVYFDAGIHPSRIQRLGLIIANVPFFVTHEHVDHAGFAKTLNENYGTPICATRGTKEAIKIGYRDCRISFASVHEIRMIPVVHAAAEPCAFYLDIDGERVLYIADAGSPPELPEGLAPDVLIVEANYTPKRMAENAEKSDSMLYVSGRVSSGVGHLSAREAAQLIEPYLDYADLIILFHQSENNFDYTEYHNDPEISDAFKAKAQFARAGMTWNSIPF
jgi:ribonuclease BN (tRNA processing enzyme)